MVYKTHIRDNIWEPKIPEYTLHKTDRQTGPKGGTAVYLRQNIKHYVADTPDVEHLEATVVQVETNRDALHLFSCYNPPGVWILDNDLRSLFAGNTSIISTPSTLIKTAGAQNRKDCCSSENARIHVPQLRHRSPVLDKLCLDYSPVHAHRKQGQRDFYCGILYNVLPAVQIWVKTSKTSSPKCQTVHCTVPHQFTPPVLPLRFKQSISWLRYKIF